MDIKKLSGHLPYLIVIIIITVLFYLRPFNLTDFPGRDPALFYIPGVETAKQSIMDYKDPFPLWNPHRFSGMPYYGKGNYLGLDSALLGPLIFITNSSVKATRINYITDMILAGIFMYILLISLNLKKKFAFIGSFIYLFNGYALYIYGHGWLTSTNGYMFSPLVLLFVIKAFKNKEWVKYSIISGIILMLQFRAGPDLKVGLWIMLMLVVYGLLYIIGKNFKKKLVKTILIGVIVSLVFLGLSAERIFVTKEHIDIGSRGHLSWKESSGRKIPLNKLFTKVIEPVYEGMPKVQRTGSGGYQVGIIAFLLGCFTIYKKKKNKFTIFLTLSALLSLSIAMGSFIFYFLWKYVPPFDSTRYVIRALSLFVFVWSILAAFGASCLFKTLNEKFKWNKRKEIIAYSILVILLFLNLIVFNYTILHPDYSNVEEVIQDNHILQSLSKEKEENIFRIHTYETNGIDWGIDLWNVPLNLEHIYAYESAWYPPYFNGYLAMAYRDRAKFYGILNVKYMTAKNEINISNFKFVKKFENCTKCFPGEDLQKAWGPYLYENEQFLPRAYVVDNSVLVVGAEETVTQTIYALMLNPNFKPDNTVIIRGKKSINDHKIEDLKKFSVIFLTQGSIDQNSAFKLEQYTESGGKLIPDVTKNKNSISEDEINSLFNSFKGELNQINDKNIIMHNFDKREIKLNKQKGFLVYSEKFSVFRGWKVKDDKNNKPELLNADAMISSVHLDGTMETLTFEYKPKSFTTGSYIVIITVFLLLFYFIYRIIKRKTK